MDAQTSITTQAGRSLPFGATVEPEGVNFALYARWATSVTLCLFSNSQPLAELPLDPNRNRTGQVWHLFVSGLPKDCTYAYRVGGSETPLPGHAFDPSLLLLDPYAKAVDTPNCWGQNMSKKAAEEKTGYRPKGVVFVDEPFDWQGVLGPKIPDKELIIYEMHVRGLTQDASSQVEHKGKFLGVIEKIPYLLELGVNALEFLPIQEFNEMELPRLSSKTKRPLYNYWGYSTVNFFSLMNRYAVGEKPGAVVNEFKTMVRELHRHGIEVILDVVFNHTAEGLGYTLSYRGIDNTTYYMVDGEGKNRDYTGCGNTFNSNHPVVRELILDCLRYLVVELHVDGFRFDLASALTRDPNGAPLASPPLIEAITLDPVLSQVTLIAEPWDVGGLYQVGSFFELDARWKEWNGHYRDTVRRFIKGDSFQKNLFATRLGGSQDLYGNVRGPLNSTNFVIAHDGFTLADLVSYNQKHNLDNGEENRDGLNENDSWNCGVEGPSINKKVLALREQQMRNLHLALMVSQGVPMICMGDEYGHTRLGNNNSWGHDDSLNWFLWDKWSEKSAFFNFYKFLIQFRKQNPILNKGTFLSPEEIQWHSQEPLKVDWGVDDKLIAFTIGDLYIAFNAAHLPVTLNLPNPPEGKRWHLIVDTHASPPNDFHPEESALLIARPQFRLMSYSSVLLKAKGA
jgi:isoamylase